MVVGRDVESITYEARRKESCKTLSIYLASLITFIMIDQKAITGLHWLWYFILC